jgi:hypothetical protein
MAGTTELRQQSPDSGGGEPTLVDEPVLVLTAGESIRLAPFDETLEIVDMSATYGKIDLEARTYTAPPYVPAGSVDTLEIQADSLYRVTVYIQPNEADPSSAESVILRVPDGFFSNSEWTDGTKTLDLSEVEDVISDFPILVLEESEIVPSPLKVSQLVDISPLADGGFPLVGVRYDEAAMVMVPMEEFRFFQMTPNPVPPQKGVIAVERLLPKAQILPDRANGSKWYGPEKNAKLIGPNRDQPFFNISTSHCWDMFGQVIGSGVGFGHNSNATRVVRPYRWMLQTERDVAVCKEGKWTFSHKQIGKMDGTGLQVLPTPGSAQWSKMRPDGSPNWAQGTKVSRP